MMDVGGRWWLGGGWGVEPVVGRWGSVIPRPLYSSVPPDASPGPYIPPANTRLFTDEGLNLLLQESVSEEFPGNGNRHKAFLHLGFEAIKLSCTQADLKRLAQLAAQMYSTSEYDYREILRNMQDSYDNAMTKS